MNGEERMMVASELIRLARQHIVAATSTVDTVTERRQMVEAAKKLRKAADFLDDEGAMTE